MDTQQKSHGKRSNRPLLIGLLLTGIVCLIIAGMLSIKLAHQMKQEPFPIPREVNINQIESWMTIHYIARTYHVPEQLFLQKLSITPTESRTISIEILARRRNIAADTLIKTIKQIITEHSPIHSRPQLQTS